MSMASSNNQDSATAAFRVWGCRGSVPISGPAFARHGGATTCFCVEGPEGRIILDAGSGLAALGRSPDYVDRPTLLLLSHYHTDHVLGFPHFPPLFRPGWDLHVAGVPRAGRSPLEALVEVHHAPFFPVPLRDVMQATVHERVHQLEGEGVFGGVRYAWTEVAHPGGASSFSFQHQGGRLVVASDVELEALTDDRFASFVRGAAVLVIDAQFRDDEYPRFKGWGHSTAEQAARFAAANGVGQLVLCHHDVARTDDAIDQMVTSARAIMPNTVAAYEGLTISL